MLTYKTENILKDGIFLFIIIYFTYFIDLAFTLLVLEFGMIICYQIKIILTVLSF